MSKANFVDALNMLSLATFLNFRSADARPGIEKYWETERISFVILGKWSDFSRVVRILNFPRPWSPLKTSLTRPRTAKFKWATKENSVFSDSRGQHLCKFIGTKESVYLRKEFNSYRTGLGHKHGRRFIVLGRQYGRHDVMWKHTIVLWRNSK